MMSGCQTMTNWGASIRENLEPKIASIDGWIEGIDGAIQADLVIAENLRDGKPVTENEKARLVSDIASIAATSGDAKKTAELVLIAIRMLPEKE